MKHRNGYGENFRWAAPVVALAAAVVYWNSLDGSFVFDDAASIVDNPTLRSLRAIGRVLSPPFSAGQTVGGRPLVNFTLALNHASSGAAPWSYHLANLLIHLGAALTLFAWLRRTPGAARRAAFPPLCSGRCIRFKPRP